jgi:hypothetical protein
MFDEAPKPWFDEAAKSRRKLDVLFKGPSPEAGGLRHPFGSFTA